MSTQEATLIAASLAFLAALANAVITLVNGVRSRRHSAFATIAAHRVEWIERLRENVSAFCVEIVNHHHYREKKGAWNTEIIAQVNQQLSYICLLLDENDSEHSELKNLCRRAVNFKDDYHEDGRYAFVGQIQSQIESQCSTVIKSTWRQAKREMRGIAA